MGMRAQYVMNGRTRTRDQTRDDQRRTPAACDFSAARDCDAGSNRRVGANDIFDILTAVAAATILMASSLSPRAETGSVRISIAKPGSLSSGGGQGILSFNGKNYRLSIGGVSVGTIGAAKAIVPSRLRIRASSVG